MQLHGFEKPKGPTESAAVPLVGPLLLVQYAIVGLIAVVGVLAVINLPSTVL